MKVSHFELLKKIAGIFILIVLFCGLYLKLVILPVSIQIDLELVDVKHSEMKVYWADKRQGYAEKNMRRVKVKKGRFRYKFRFPELDGLVYFRIDPIDRKGHVVIHGINVNKPGFHPVEFNDRESFLMLTPGDEYIDNLKINSGNISFRSTGNDPNLSLKAEFSRVDSTQLTKIILVFLLIVLIFTACYRMGIGANNDVNFVPVLGLIVVTLCITMAANSKIGVHPDESLHVRAVNYYQHNNLPPSLDAEEIKSTYSIYGVSRLSSFELFYPLAGYFSRLVDYLEFNLVNHARLFNLLLIGSLVLFCWRNPMFSYFLLPLLVSAQGWYLFSYANSDALGLFMCIIVSYQVAFEASLLNRYLSKETPNYLALKSLLLGLLLGVMLLLKVNYYFFVLFAGLFVLWRYWTGEFSNKRLFWKRLAVLIMIGLVPYGVRLGLDISINGADRDELIMQMRELRAEPTYKPSRVLEETASSLYLRDKGVSAYELYDQYRWAEISFRSAFGSYGYAQYHAPEVLYDWVRYSGIFILILILSAIMIWGCFSGYFLFVMACVCSALLIAASFYNSWTVDLQPQGRYLMPILSILGIVLYRIKEYVWGFGLNVMVIWMFLLASYSFIFIGIRSF